jgi:hypothetical protein
VIFDKGLFREKVPNFSGKKGIHPLVHLTACICRLAYGDLADRDDENLDMAESTINMSLKQFNKLMIEEFGAQYLNPCPLAAEIECVIFPGMFASWDCKHFSWKNCPVSLAGQYMGKESDKTLVLEVIANTDLYIWYYFFGEAGSLNDINILNKSTIVGSILNGTFDLKIAFYTINNTHRDWLYFLVDGIYPKYSIFINSFQHPHDEKEKYFAKCQEACRKDIKRAFSVLVQQFQILQRPIKNWYWTDIVDIMDVCIILQNMIVESCRRISQFPSIWNLDPPSGMPQLMCFPHQKLKTIRRRSYLCSKMPNWRCTFGSQFGNSHGNSSWCGERKHSKHCRTLFFKK